MKKIKLLVKQLLIVLTLAVIIMPISMIASLAVAPKAQAAETKSPPVQKKVVVSEALQESLPVLEQTKGFSRQMTYHQGERIQVGFVFSGRVLRVWAKIGQLDPNFPETVNLLNSGNNGFLLETPRLTSALKKGQQNLEIYAENSAGVKVSSFLLNLELKQITISPKVVVFEDSIRLFWVPVKGAEKYLVGWNAKGETVFHLQVTEETKITLKNLSPGTVYEVEISAIGPAGSLGEPQKMSLLTSGVAPQKKVAGEESAKKITPAIGSGISTTAPKVAQKEKTPETPAPEESPKPEETTTGGWNRLLVALAILIIAAGAAIGGYYGYEWFIGRSKDEEPPAPSSSNRW